jgi:hypothetical protein
MRCFAPLALILAACASTPRSEGIDHAMFEGFAVEPVREAARIVVEEVGHRWSVVRITDTGSVMTEGWIGVCGEQVTCSTRTGYPGAIGRTPWATIEVRFRDLGVDTGVEVEIEYEDCDPDVSCQPELLGSTGVLESQIIDGMRAILRSTSPPDRRPG